MPFHYTGDMEDLLSLWLWMLRRYHWGEIEEDFGYPSVK